MRWGRESLRPMWIREPMPAQIFCCSKNRMLSRQLFARSALRVDRLSMRYWSQDSRPIRYLYSVNLNIRSLMRYECAICVPLLRAKEETLWLAKSFQVTAQAVRDSDTQGLGIIP